MARYVVATVEEIPPGARKIVKVAGREIGIFNIGKEFFALINRCPHEGGALCRGRLVGLMESDRPGEYRLTRHGEMLRCPWHGWEFDIRTGQSWCDPVNTKVRSYNITVEPGEMLVKGPYVAETVSVTVEREYLVVEV
jgi:3-phenylpropionate/trans-cinnamate dioxygenase ferredoxin subunit